MSLWTVSKALQIPIDCTVTNVLDLPYTITFCMRKRMQIDNYNELPKEKRPTDYLIWNGSSEELDDWLDKVLYNKKTNEAEFVISDRDIE